MMMPNMAPALHACFFTRVHVLLKDAARPEIHARAPLVSEMMLNVAPALQAWKSTRLEHMSSLISGLLD